MDISKYLIIDRIEANSIAVCEADGAVMKNIPLDQIEGSPREGDLLFPSGGKYIIDEKATKTRKIEMSNLVKGLWSEDEE